MQVRCGRRHLVQVRRLVEVGCMSGGMMGYTSGRIMRENNVSTISYLKSDPIENPAASKL
jgi:hypothetical protein